MPRAARCNGGSAACLTPGAGPRRHESTALSRRLRRRRWPALPGVRRHGRAATGCRPGPCPHRHTPMALRDLRRHVDSGVYPDLVRRAVHAHSRTVNRNTGTARGYARRARATDEKPPSDDNRRGTATARRVEPPRCSLEGTILRRSSLGAVPENSGLPKTTERTRTQNTIVLQVHILRASPMLVTFRRNAEFDPYMR